MISKQQYKSYFLSISILLLLFYTFSYLVPVIGLWVNLSIQPSFFIATLLLTVLSSYWISKQVFSSKYLFHSIIINLGSVLLLLLSVWISLNIYDVSFDGQTYHMEAIMDLVNGWNPIHPNASEIEVTTWTSIHYPKAFWYAASNAISFFEWIEIGKMYNIILLLATLLLSIVLISDLFSFKTWQTVLISLFLAFNPIVSSQFLSYYLDGQISSLIILLIGGVILFFKNKQTSLGLLLILASSMALINLKFPSLAYAYTFCAIFLLFVWIQQGFKTFFRWSILFGIVLLSSTFFIGYNPYFQNTVEHHHPFYPLNEKDILGSNNYPKNFYQKNRLYKLFHSNFSYQGCILGDEESQLKNPFTQGVMQTYKYTDTRIGAFGPYFGLILILTLIGSIILLFFNKNQIIKRNALFIGLTIGLTILIHPESWWGRYIPQFYLIPFMVMLLLLDSQKRWLKFVGLVVFIFIGLNNVMLTSSSISYHISTTNKINTHFKEIGNQPVTFYLCEFHPFEYRLKEKGINYRIVDDLNQLPCQNPTELYKVYCSIYYCIEE